MLPCQRHSVVTRWSSRQIVPLLRALLVPSLIDYRLAELRRP